jgi:hypothetical protein
MTVFTPDTVPNTAAAIVAAANRLKRTALPEGAWATADLSVYLASEAEVDEIAGQWKADAAWNPARTVYSALVEHGSHQRVRVWAYYVTPEHAAARSGEPVPDDISSLVSPYAAEEAQP